MINAGAGIKTQVFLSVDLNLPPSIFLPRPLPALALPYSFIHLFVHHSVKECPLCTHLFYTLCCTLNTVVSKTLPVPGAFGLMRETDINSYKYIIGNCNKGLILFKVEEFRETIHREASF